MHSVSSYFEASCSGVVLVGFMLHTAGADVGRAVTHLSKTPLCFARYAVPFVFKHDSIADFVEGLTPLVTAAFLATDELEALDVV